MSILSPDLDCCNKFWLNSELTLFKVACLDEIMFSILASYSFIPLFSNTKTPLSPMYGCDILLLSSEKK